MTYRQPRSGYTVGGGAEFGVTEHVSVRGEYAYVDFGNVLLGTETGAGGATAAIRSDVKFHLFRVAANWRF